MVDIVALHGFSQRGAMFEELEHYLEVPVVAPDLPGHGEEFVRSWEETIEMVADLLGGHPSPPILAGYSMGGRIALGVALHRPEVMSGLIMMSAAPGIADAAARKARLTSDRDLAKRIGSVGIEAFVDAWYGRPMFAGLQSRGAEWIRSDRDIRVSNTGAGVAAALRSLGQGVQPDYRPLLGGLAVRTLLITGEHDERYRALCGEMAGLMPDVSSAVILGAGHAVVGERPESVAEAILAWAGD